MAEGYPSRQGVEENREAWDREAELHARIRALKPKSSAEFFRLEHELRRARLEENGLDGSDQGSES